MITTAAVFFIPSPFLFLRFFFSNLIYGKLVHSTHNSIIKRRLNSIFQRILFKKKNYYYVQAVRCIKIASVYNCIAICLISFKICLHNKIFAKVTGTRTGLWGGGLRGQQLRAPKNGAPRKCMKSPGEIYTFTIQHGGSWSMSIPNICITQLLTVTLSAQTCTIPFRRIVWQVYKLSLEKIIIRFLN